MQREPDLFEQTWSKPFALSSHHRHTHGASDESPDDFDGVMPMGPVPSQSASVCTSSAVPPAAIGQDRHDFVPKPTRGGAARIGRKKRAVECIDPYSAEVLCVFDSQRAAARHLCIPQSAPSHRFPVHFSCAQCAHSCAGKSSSVVRLRRSVGGANAVAS